MPGWRRGTCQRHWMVVPGYTYIGPCRCGFGPHTFYRDPTGRIVSAWELFRTAPPTPTKEELEEEVKRLKEEKAALEKRIEELEKKLSEQ